MPLSLSIELWITKILIEKHYYYIHRKDYSAECDIWEPEENLIKETLDLWLKSIKTRRTSRISQVRNESRRRSV